MGKNLGTGLGLTYRPFGEGPGGLGGRALTAVALARETVEALELVLDWVIAHRLAYLVTKLEMRTKRIISKGAAASTANEAVPIRIRLRDKAVLQVLEELLLHFRTLGRQRLDITPHRVRREALLQIRSHGPRLFVGFRERIRDPLRNLIHHIVDESVAASTVLLRIPRVAVLATLLVVDLILKVMSLDIHLEQVISPVTDLPNRPATSRFLALSLLQGRQHPKCFERFLVAVHFVKHVAGDVGRRSLLPPLETTSRIALRAPLQLRIRVAGLRAVEGKASENKRPGHVAIRLVDLNLWHRELVPRYHVRQVLGGIVAGRLTQLVPARIDGQAIAAEEIQSLIDVHG